MVLPVVLLVLVLVLVVAKEQDLKEKTFSRDIAQPKCTLIPCFRRHCKLSEVYTFKTIYYRFLVNPHPR